MDRRIGAQLYTVRELCTTPEDFRKTIKRIADAGFKTVQLSGVPDSVGSAKELKKVFDENGIEIIGTHRPIQNYIENVKGEIEFHKDLGTSIAGVGFLPPEYRTNAEVLRETIRKCNEAQRELKKEGITLAWHNHGFEFAKIEGKKSVMDIILEEGEFDLILDAYWLAYVGIDPARFIKKAGKRVAIVHLKDIRVLPDNSLEYAEVGEGNILWNEVLEASRDARFAVIEQDTCHGDPVDSLKMSYDYLTTNFDLI